MDTMAELRVATRQPHARVEAAIGIMDPALVTSTYVGILRRFLGFYEPVEARLARCEGLREVFCDFDTRRKSPWLQQDLKFLGQDADVAHCGAIPALDCLPRALGCLYVLEGATLGGQVISRHLRTSLGLDAACGAAFFSGYGARTAIMWRGMQAMLRRALASPADIQVASAAACEVFLALENWLVSEGYG